jgi:hypothetical protein
LRVAILTLAGAAILAVAGCGGDDAKPPKPEPRVRLEITAPSDTATVHRGTVDVRGRVTPATATVRVLGRPALVSDGSFTVVVPLDPGVNVVDVSASARGRRSALTAFRVTREQRIAVPDLKDVDVDELESTLEELGLVAVVERGGGILDPFVPSGLGVCEQDPVEGTRVRRGATVRVVVARSC